MKRLDKAIIASIVIKVMGLIAVLIMTQAMYGCSLRHDKYTTKDIWANMTFHTLNVMDYAGTDKSLHDFPGEIIESNKMFGPNPNHQQLILATLAVSAVFELVVWFTPQKYRWMVQGSGIASKAIPVVNNYKVYEAIAAGR